MAMENDPFQDVSPIKNGGFPASYVSLPGRVYVGGTSATSDLNETGWWFGTTGEPGFWNEGICIYAQ